jgi:hypothetical protein
MESGYAYPGRSENNPTKACANAGSCKQVSEQRMALWYPQKSAEVIVNRNELSSQEKRSRQKPHGKLKDRMLEGRKRIKQV